MASVTVNGLDGLIDDLAELARLPGHVVEDMLNAEADDMEDEIASMVYGAEVKDKTVHYNLIYRIGDPVPYEIISANDGERPSLRPAGREPDPAQAGDKAGAAPTPAARTASTWYSSAKQWILRRMMSVASVTVNGLDGLIDDLAELARLPGHVVEDMLNAEADVIVSAQRDEISSRWRGPYSQGISAQSVKKTKVKQGRDGRSLSIYPQGSRRRKGKSTRNAEIAFINEYGAPKRGIAARPAIAAANRKKEKEAVEAGEKVYHAYLDSKNL